MWVSHTPPLQERPHTPFGHAGAGASLDSPFHLVADAHLFATHNCAPTHYIVLQKGMIDAEGSGKWERSVPRTYFQTVLLQQEEEEEATVDSKTERESDRVSVNSTWMKMHDVLYCSTAYYVLGEMWGVEQEHKMESRRMCLCLYYLRFPTDPTYS